MPRQVKPLQIESYIAEAAITANMVVARGDADGNCDVMEAGDLPLGIAMHAAAIGDPVQVVTLGKYQAVAGAAVTAANVRDGRMAIAAATTGKVTAATLGGTTSAFAVGRFEEPAGADGDLVTIFVDPQQIVTT